MSDTLFTKIINREIEADIVYEDDTVLAFRDIAPQAPLHVLVIPKKPIVMLAQAGEADRDVLGHMMLTAAKVAASEGYGDAFRLAMNNGEKVGQSVFHMHLHVLAGRAFEWPPG